MTFLKCKNKKCHKNAIFSSDYCLEHVEENNKKKKEF